MRLAFTNLAMPALRFNLFGNGKGEVKPPTLVVSGNHNIPESTLVDLEAETSRKNFRDKLHNSPRDVETKS